MDTSDILRGQARDDRGAELMRLLCAMFSTGWCVFCGTLPDFCTWTVQSLCSRLATFMLLTDADGCAFGLALALSGPPAPMLGGAGLLPAMVAGLNATGLNPWPCGGLLRLASTACHELYHCGAMSSCHRKLCRICSTFAQLRA